MSNKTCDSCGRVIPDSENRSMSDIDTYWCDECEGLNAEQPETGEQMDRRLNDRDALGVEPREDNPL